MRIVPAFDVAEEDEARVGMRRKAMLCEAFVFEGGEEALRHRIVVSVATRAHRGAYAEELTPLPERKSSILVVSIGRCTTSLRRWWYGWKTEVRSRRTAEAVLPWRAHRGTTRNSARVLGADRFREDQ